MLKIKTRRQTINIKDHKGMVFVDNTAVCENI
jgi:hypothetical protein